MKKHQIDPHKYQTLGMSMGMCLGISIGMTIGFTVFDQGLLGMVLGLSLGMVLGIAWGMDKDKKVNAQLQDKGYTILAITPKTDAQDEYAVTISDKNGQKQLLLVSKGDMEVEQFEIGDLVYLDEDGDMEQVMDKDEKNRKP